MATETSAHAGQESRPAVDFRAWFQSGRVRAGLLSLGTLLLYWNTQTSANTFDAVSYANQIAHLYPRTHDPHWLFHPHHLLFNALGYVLWRMARSCGYRGGSLVVLQDLNSVLGAAGVTVYYLTLKRLLQRSRGLPVLIAAGLALSFGCWICGTDGRVNMPSLFLMLAAFAVLSQLMVSPRPALAAWTGLLAGGAVLFHESAGLFVVVGLAGVLLSETTFRRRLPLLLAYGAAWGITSALPYLIVGVFVLHLHTPAEFHAWTSEYSELGWWWDFRVLHNLSSDFFALRHASFVEPGPRPSFWILGLYSLSVVGWLAAAYAIVAALPQLWRGHNRNLIIVLLLWSFVYAAFFTVWSPGYFVFWVPVLVPASLLLAQSASPDCMLCLNCPGRGCRWYFAGCWPSVHGCSVWQIYAVDGRTPLSRSSQALLRPMQRRSSCNADCTRGQPSAALAPYPTSHRVRPPVLHTDPPDQLPASCTSAQGCKVQLEGIRPREEPAGGQLRSRLTA